MSTGESHASTTSFTLSAFADEIGPDPQQQVDVLSAAGVKHIEFRSILNTNVLALSDAQIDDFKALLDRHGFGLSAIGSPIGKIRIDEPFAPHLERFERAIALCDRLGTRNIRIFSYYPPQGHDTWDTVGPEWVQQVYERMGEKIRRAEAAGVVLMHENEHRIYGDSPARLADLYARFTSPALVAVYDAANYVFCGYDPLEGWAVTKERTKHFHIKDWKRGAQHGSLAGEGDGHIPTVIAEAAARGYSGFATLEPHLLGGGPTGGVTGPELFPKAIDAFRGILQRIGVSPR
jgi:3-dehydroshikimate dehydratase